MITLQFLLTALVVVVAPGTGVVYTLAIGLAQGRRAAAWAALGCTFGILPHLLAATLGLAALMHTSALMFGAVKWLGVAYLLYLAWGMMRDSGTLAVSAAPVGTPGWKIAGRGALINILNPKLSIFFLALLPPFLSGNASHATAEMTVLGSVFMVLTFAVFLIYGSFAAAARNKLLNSQTAMRWLGRSFAAVFAALAGRLALERA